MDILNFVDSFFKYKTKYYESITEYFNVLNLSKKDFLNVICFNIRSINANFDHLLLSFENDVNFRFLDVIVLTETWHDPNNCNHSLNGFQMYHTKIKRNQNDGIIIFIRENFSVEINEYGCNECNIIKLILCDKANNNNFNILCIYRSPNMNNNDFLAYLNNILITDKSLNDRTLIIGDTNNNIIGTDSTDNEYLNIFSSNGFYTFVNIFTRLPINNTHSCIDHIFIKYNDENVLSNIQAGVLQICITDHFPIITSIPLLKMKGKIVVISIT